MFEAGARTNYDLQQTASGRPQYKVTVPVPGYEPRVLTIKVYGYDQPSAAEVVADGPADSPHRYPGGSLCMWLPADPPGERWEPRQGLLALIDLAVLHLFREAWWRDTGVWAGREASHGQPKVDPEHV